MKKILSAAEKKAAIRDIVEKADGDVWLSSTAWKAVKKYIRPRMPTYIGTNPPFLPHMVIKKATFYQGIPIEGIWVNHELNLVER